MRIEIISHLPNNPAMEAVSSFIDQGFDNSTNGGTVTNSSSNTVTQSGQPQPSQQQPTVQVVNPNVKL
jgi:hypothetical protein